MYESWASIENDVRSLASIIWGRSANPERISGVNFDAVLRISSEEIILIEITKECNLEKIRTDIAKLQPVKANFIQNSTLAKAYIIITEKPTPGMTELARDSKINLITIHDFTKLAFDYNSYTNARKKLAFGSAINPSTGQPDQHEYIPVVYTSENGRKEFTTENIADKIKKKERIVLLGDYGTGKSRCTKEIFEILAKTDNKSIFTLSINLREHWGSSSSVEIIAGHLKRMGLSSAIDKAMHLLNEGHINLILDGFDEVGSQTFGSNESKRESIRREALKGVRELIRDCKGGVLITGRPHYFNSNNEMFNSLGIDLRNSNSSLIRCASEFTTAQAAKYLNSINIKSGIPAWLPKKPLMFLILADIDQKEAEHILSSSNGEIGFWGQFIDTVCLREAKIHTSIDPLYVRQVLTNLAKQTRCSSRPLGRISPKDVNKAYEDATGLAPDESGQLMLSRLCTLGRIEPESPDRQFVDPYIVQLLFAESTAEDISNKNYKILDEPWSQALTEIGIFFLAQWIEQFDLEPECHAIINRIGRPENTQATGEIISALSLIPDMDYDFKNVTIEIADIPILALGNSKISNLTIRDCLISELSFDNCKADEKSNIFIERCKIRNASGLTSTPAWVKESPIENTKSISNAKRIKQSNLPASQKLLLSIIQKIFFQRGGGRKEATLYKGGFGQQFDRKIIDKILSLLVNDGYIEKSKDSSGFIYNPNREYTSKMKAIKDQLSLCQDSLWLKVLEFDE